MRVMPSATAKSGAHRTDERRWNDANERIYPRRRHRGVGPKTIARDGEKPDASAPGETRRPSLGERGEDQGDGCGGGGGNAVNRMISSGLQVR